MRKDDACLALQYSRHIAALLPYGGCRKRSSYGKRHAKGKSPLFLARAATCRVCQACMAFSTQISARGHLSCNMSFCLLKKLDFLRVRFGASAANFVYMFNCVQQPSTANTSHVSQACARFWRVYLVSQTNFQCHLAGKMCAFLRARFKLRLDLTFSNLVVTEDVLMRCRLLGNAWCWGGGGWSSAFSPS